jgi:lysine 6-dehydrogenase
LPESFAGRVQQLDYKTIRHPGHCEKFKTMIDLGLASSVELEIDGARVTPRRVFGEMLLRHLPADEPDAVLIRLEFRGRLQRMEDALVQQLAEVGQISGEETETHMFRKVIRQAVGEQDAPGGKQAVLRYDIIDYFDGQTGLSAMMRTTAFPASIIAQMMARGETLMKGATPQERCIPPKAFVAALAARNIHITETMIDE